MHTPVTNAPVRVEVCSNVTFTLGCGSTSAVYDGRSRRSQRTAQYHSTYRSTAGPAGSRSRSRCRACSCGCRIPLPSTVSRSSKTSYAGRREAGCMTTMNTGRVNPVPDGYHALTPYLAVADGAKAIESYTAVFGAEQS